MFQHYALPLYALTCALLISYARGEADHEVRGDDLQGARHNLLREEVTRLQRVM